MSKWNSMQHFKVNHSLILQLMNVVQTWKSPNTYNVTCEAIKAWAILWATKQKLFSYLRNQVWSISMFPLRWGTERRIRAHSTEIRPSCRAHKRRAWLIDWGFLKSSIFTYIWSKLQIHVMFQKDLNFVFTVTELTPGCILVIGRR